MKEIDNLSKAIEHARLLREKFLSDPERPYYHFVCPEDYGVPGDPNGAFFARGRYHLMYLYDRRDGSFCWGHISSADLLHWRAHPDALFPDDLDGGIFSGGAFLDDDGTCYLSYWGLAVNDKSQGGIRIAKSSDRFYEKWEKCAEYAMPCTEWGIYQSATQDGKPCFLGCADPSNIWKKDGKYYMQAGNLCVLLKNKVFEFDGALDEKTGTDAPEETKGDWVELLESDDLKNWRYLHRFYKRNGADNWTFAYEDDMCPSFLPLPRSKDGGELSGKYLQLFISHTRGCQYYIGEYDKEKNLFVPETYGRMTWVDNAFFAPEALIDGKNRQIMWAWLQDYGRFISWRDEEDMGWSGVYGLPRTLWLKADSTLGIAPVPELENLRCNTRKFGNITAKEAYELEDIYGLSCEIRLSADMTKGDEVGVYVRANADLSEYTRIYYKNSEGKLYFDAVKSGAKGRRVIESAPLELADGEDISITVFVDKTVIEVFANEKQAISRRVHPGALSERVLVYGDTTLEDVTVHEMSPTNFC